MTATLVVHDWIVAELEAASKHPLETAGVLLCGLVESSDGVRLLARELLWVAEEHYAARNADGLSIRSEGYVHSLQRASDTATTPVWLHSSGDRVTTAKQSTRRLSIVKFADLFRMRAGSNYYGAVIIAPQLNESRSRGS